MSHIRWENIHQQIKETEKILDEERHYSDEEINRILHQRAELLASESKQNKEISKLTPIVECMLGSEHYGIESIYVEEVCKVKNMNSLPSVPPFMEGVINIHGKVFCVINLSLFFNLADTKLDKMRRIIILHYDEIELGIAVDKILGMGTTDLTRLQPSLPNLTGYAADYIKGITSHQLIILNIPKLLKSHELIINHSV